MTTNTMTITPEAQAVLEAALEDQVIENELYVEISLPDGSVARWWRDTDDEALIDRLTNAVEDILGSPDTLLT